VVKAAENGEAAGAPTADSAAPAATDKPAAGGCCARLPDRKTVVKILKALRLTFLFYLLGILLGEIENAQFGDCGFFSGWTCFTPYSCEQWKNGLWDSDPATVDRGYCWTWIDELYWATMTLVTIGYGDVSPHTKAGKLIASFLVTLGVFCFTTAIAELVEIQQSKRLGAEKTLRQRIES